jgi:hypothetical protein
VAVNEEVRPESLVVGEAQAVFGVIGHGDGPEPGEVGELEGEVC